MATLTYPAQSLPEFSQTFGQYSGPALMHETETTLQDLGSLSCVDLQLAAAIRESMQPSGGYGDQSFSSSSTEYSLSDQFRVIGTSEDRYMDDSCVPMTELQNSTEIFKWVDKLDLPMPSVNYDDDDDTSVVLELEDLSFLDITTNDCNSDGENSYGSSSRDDTPSPNSIASSDYQPALPAFDYICNKPKQFDFEEETDEEEFEKPYCKSRRGAKNVLLWKFILQVLEARPDLAKWVNRRDGTFKFVDTTVMSRMWGEKKRKRDMTFEKLSRGIRHYYKSGLMSRIEGTRLVYKFNWPSVPKPYRKN